LPESVACNCPAAGLGCNLLIGSAGCKGRAGCERWHAFVIVCVLLGFVGYHFAIRTLRLVTAVFALAVIVAVTRYGVARQGAVAHADLVNSFTLGFDDLGHAFFQPPLGHNNPIPGRLGWLVIIGLLVLAYRELEVWAMRWQPPTVDCSTSRPRRTAVRQATKTTP